MAQELIQTQAQKQQQLQKLTAQQMLQVKLLEMPLTELEENVRAELDDNPALEISGEAEDAGETYDAGADNDTHTDNDDYEQAQEREERQDALDAALERMTGDDNELPTYDAKSHMQGNADYEEMVYGDTTSFIDKLNEQLGVQDITEQQREIVEYLIGSLDGDGLLRKDLDSITDELAIYHNIDVSAQDINKALEVLQGLEPAGIGARSLQECLLLQIHHKQEELKPVNTTQKKQMAVIYNLVYVVLSEYWDAFAKKHWDKIQAAMKLSEPQVELIQREIRKLNPKPGASMGETMGRSLDQVTPDFIVDTNEDGTITFQLNYGELPQLQVSPSFAGMVQAYKDNRRSMNRKDKEALLYAKEKVEKARGYIEAIRQRRQTLILTMQTIIELQRPFFLDGDEADIRPMILQDIADRTGLDKSTISRVSNIKYAQTKWGTFPLRFFFSDDYVTEDGKVVSTRQIKLVLKEIIEGEDKSNPMSDEALAKALKARGLSIARRTVAKYREQLGQPIARLRKE